MMKLVKGAMLGALLATAATPSFATVSKSATPDKEFYADFLDYIKAQFAFNGAEMTAFEHLNLSAADMKALTDSFSDLSKAQLKLAEYLQNKITVS